MEDYVRWFSDISKDDVTWVGGKGANLGELTQLGLNVPKGFCITVSAYWDFLDETKKVVMDRISAIDFKDTFSLQKKSREIRDIVTEKEIPGSILNAIKKAYIRLSEDGKNPVAVRSSATAEDLPGSSFAGQHETFLNVVGEEQLAYMVKECWASLWTPRAILYREKQGFDHEKVGMCIVIQKMVFPSVSGVMFTYNSVKGTGDEVVIESTFGLGEGLVSGIVTPDSFIIRKNDFKIIDRNISEKKQMIVSERKGTIQKEVPEVKQNTPSLSVDNIRKLIKIGLRIEDHYNTPQDIEWCLSDGSTYILQSRPVTDMGRVVPQLKDEELSTLEGEWTKSPLDERVQEPLTPFTWSIARESIPSFFEALRAFGFRFPEEEKMVRLFFGRPYVSKTELEQVFGNMPGVVDDFLLGGQAQIDPKKVKFSFSMIPMGFRALIMVNQVHKDWDREYPRILSEFEILKKFDLKSATPPELLKKMDHILGLANSIAATHALSIIFCEALYQVLVMYVSRYTGEDPNILCPKLVAGLAENKTLEANKNLWELATLARLNNAIFTHVSKGNYAQMAHELNVTKEGREYLKDFQDFLKIYGHRSPKYDLIYPSWGDDPDLVLELVLSYLNSDSPHKPKDMEIRGIKDRKRATALVLNNLNSRFIDKLIPVKRMVFLKLLSLAQKYMELRENQQFYIGQGYPIARRTVLEIGSRFGKVGIISEPSDVFFLKMDEIRDIVYKKEVKDIDKKIVKRKSDFEAFKNIEPPAIITKDGPREWATKNILKGIGGSPGMASGKVRIISDISEFCRFKEGEILVSPTTNPSWTPLFIMASAVVTEVGGMLSHGAVVAREYQIPAVLGLKNATKILKDGQQITVDGAKGIIYTKE
jgi:pyruvate,water dikinase